MLDTDPPIVAVPRMLYLFTEVEEVECYGRYWEGGVTITAVLEGPMGLNMAALRRQFSPPGNTVSVSDDFRRWLCQDYGCRIVAYEEVRD